MTTSLGLNRRGALAAIAALSVNRNWFKMLLSEAEGMWPSAAELTLC